MRAPLTPGLALVCILCYSHESLFRHPVASPLMGVRFLEPSMVPVENSIPFLYSVGLLLALKMNLSPYSMLEMLFYILGLL